MIQLKPLARRDSCDTSWRSRGSASTVTTVTDFQRVAIDIETDGLDASQIWCVGVVDLETGREMVFGPDRLAEGFSLIERAEELWLHNGIAFDLPVLKRLHGVEPSGLVRDTLVLARLHRPDMPGGHSLRAWGKRISVEKGEQTCTQDGGQWGAWTPAMGDYCLQDCRVTAALRANLQGLSLSSKAVELEHRFASLMQLQEERGFAFDRSAASTLAASLRSDLAALDANARKCFGGPMLLDEIVDDSFNPASRQQVAAHLLSRGWKPLRRTPTGRPVVNEETLRAANVAGAEGLADAFQIRKHLGMLADGGASWLKLVQADDRIHGRVNPCGTVSWRCTHSRPNLAQVPADKRFRSLFVPSRGWKLVGCDARSLELRVLAHYLHPYDDGVFAKRVVEEDVHEQTQVSLGLPDRSAAKRLIFALIYGAADTRLGEIVGGSTEDGTTLRRSFMARTPGFAQLFGWVRAQSAKGWLEGLNGCSLIVRSRHSALNLLIQSAGAVVMKQAVVSAVDLMTEDRKQYWEDYALVANIHDEIQVECRPEFGHWVARNLESGVRIAGERWNLRCPMAATSVIGDTWGDTH